MSFTLNLPSKTGNSHEREEIHTENNAIVIVGANGSGKSRLGVWIEFQSPQKKNVHRISAQRALSIPENVSQVPIEQAENSWRFGNPKRVDLQKEQRWGRKPATQMLSDYSQLLITLFARYTKTAISYYETSKQNQLQSPPTSIVDKLKEIWNSLLEQRELEFDFSNGQIKTKSPDIAPYHSSEMSDGERVALYLIAQCLCVPPETIIVIDEPEIHLHKAIITHLWNTLELERHDCLFVYITHDLEFAASRIGAKKLWIKEFNGSTWKWDEAPSIEEIPEDILLKILGNRQPIIFVEGEQGSIDYAIYQAVYPTYLVIPSGGSNKVSELTKSFRARASLHTFAVHGLIDRDFRPDEELKDLEKEGIFCVKVAEIENLFCTPEVLELVSQQMKLDFEKIRIAAADTVFGWLSNNLDKQATERTSSEIRFHLKRFNAKNCNSGQELKDALQNHLVLINIDQIFSENLQMYTDILTKKDYVQAMLVCNQKEIVNLITRIFGLANRRGYVDFVLRLLKEDPQNITRLSRYLPTIT